MAASIPQQTFAKSTRGNGVTHCFMASGIQRCPTIEVVAGPNPLPIVVFRIHWGDSQNFLARPSARPPRHTSQATATKPLY